MPENAPEKSADVPVQPELPPTRLSARPSCLHFAGEKLRRLSALLLALVLPVALTAASLASAAWSLGMWPKNSAARDYHVSLYLPACIPTSDKLIVRIASHARWLDRSLGDTGRDFILRHTNKVFAETEKLLANSRIPTDDVVQLQFEIVDAKGLVITKRVLKQCANDDIEVQSKLEIKDVEDAFYNIVTTHPSPNPSHYGWPVVRARDLVQDVFDSVILNVTLKGRIAETRGASKVSLLQSADVYANSPNTLGTSQPQWQIKLLNVVEMPLRFDDLRLASSSGATTSKWNVQVVEVTDTAEFLSQSGAQLHGLEGHTTGSNLAVEATDSDMKRLEDFVLFVSAAMFGFVIGWIVDVLRRPRLP